MPAPSTSRPLRHSQRGFSLLEVSVVTALVGATAAVALPHMVEVADQARLVALQSTGHSATSALVVNRATCSLPPHANGAPSACLQVSDCADVGKVLVGGLPVGVYVQPGPLPTDGQEGRCTLGMANFNQTVSFAAVAAPGR